MVRKLICFSIVTAFFGLLSSACVIGSRSNPCDGINCDGHGTCREVGGEAQCKCDVGYENDGPLHCVEAIKIDLRWAFNPDARGCGDAYVENVRVEMFEGSDSLLNETVDCSEGGVTISPVEDGTYDIRLTGLSEGGDSWYDASLEVTIAGNDKDLGTVVLEPLDDGDIKFTWAFGEDELDCVGAGLERLEVEVYDADNQRVFEEDITSYCSDGSVVITDFALTNWTLFLKGTCVGSHYVGYQLNQPILVAHPGENDFGLLVLNGSCK